MAAYWAGLALGLVLCLSGRPSRAQDDDALIQYCADVDGGVQFINDNTGSFSDGAVDTGMGIYKENSNCKWIIKPTSNDLRKPSLRRVVLSFQYISMEAGYDFVRVYETNAGGKLIGIFTGTTIPPVLVGTVSTLYVQFETDATGQRNGFRADWHTTGCPNACGNRGSCVFDFCYCDEGAFGGDCTSTFCVGTKKYTSIVGSLMDHYRQLDEFGVLITGQDECPDSNPNCEYNYRNNADCRWLVQPLQLSASYFTIEFMLFDTEVGRDLFILYDGPNMNSPVLLQASGNLSLPLMASSGGDVFIRFQTDKIQRKLGFFVQWDTLQECGGPTGYCLDGGQKFDGTSRPRQGRCRDPSTWAPQHDVKGRCECEFGWYGGDCSSNYCLGWSELRNRSGELVDHQDSVWVEMDEDGYNITKHQTESQYRATSFCRWYINPEPQAYGIDYLGMPNAPDLYSPINFIVLTAEYFELEPGADFLTIYNGQFYNTTRILNTNYHENVVDGVLTGSGMQALPDGRILSSGPNLFLEFKTDNANANFQPKSTSPRNGLRGFHLKYEGVLCAGRKTINMPYGNITDGAADGKRYYPRAYCQWLIAPDADQFVHPAAGIDIRIMRMDIAYDKLRIYDGNTTSSPLLGRYSQNLAMNDATELLLTSTAGQVLVEWSAGCTSSKNCLKPWCECDMFGTGWRLEWNLRPGKTMDHIKYALGPLDIWLRPTWIPYVDVAGKLVLEVPGYCSSKFTVNLSTPIGELRDRTFNSSHSYSNSADCTWYIDIRSNIQQLDIYLEYLDLDRGYYSGSNPQDNEDPDELFIYRGFVEDETNSTGNLMARLTGQLDDDTPRTWSVLHGWSNESSVGMMVRFKSSPNIVRTGFKLRWESRITSPLFTTAIGSGTVGNSAGIVSHVQVQTMWIPFCQAPEAPYPRTCHLHNSYNPELPGLCSAVLGCIPNCSWTWWNQGAPNFDSAPDDRHPNSQDIKICKMLQPGASIRMRFNYGQVLPDATDLIRNSSRTEIVWASGTHIGQGKYEMSYKSKYAGLHVMTVSQHSDYSILNHLPPIDYQQGVMLYGSPFTVSTTHTNTDPQQTIVEEIPQESEIAVGGLTGGKAGFAYLFRVQAYDMFGNKVVVGDPRSCPLAPNGYPCDTTVLSVKLDSGTTLIWGTVEDQGDGSFIVTYEASTSGVYLTHVQFLVTSEETGLASLVSVQSSPFKTTIVKVRCPRVGDEYYCNNKGTCLDSGVCVCESGWKGDYCQEDITAFLMLAIIMENAAVAAFILALLIRAFWIHFFVEKQIWERVQYEDIEEDW
jgi:hypothetical protein